MVASYIMREDDARTLNTLALAYVGDAVHELHVREVLARAGGHVAALHREAIRQVCCTAQAQALVHVITVLTETEQAIVHRGRNCHARHDAPKHASPAEYAQSTGLEALLGYLYLTGQTQRLETVLAVIDAGWRDGYANESEAR